MNVQHDCYSCKCTGTRHSAVRQEREKTSKTRALVDHNAQARFILNIHSIHNYKLVLAVTPPSLRVPSTSVGTDIVLLRTRAARLIRKENTDEDVVHPTGADEPTSGALPFDRTRAKTRAAPQPDANASFTGTLSSQNKSELLIMAAVLGIPATEKARKQDLALKIRDYLDANPNTRNSPQFGQLTWRSANRNKTSSLVPAPPSETPHGTATPHQQLPSYIPSHPPFLHFATPQMPFSVAGPSAMGSHPAPSMSSPHALQGPLLSYPPLMTPAPYLFPPPQIPPVYGQQHNWREHMPPPITQPHAHMYHLGTVPVAHRGHHPGAQENIFRSIG